MWTRADAGIPATTGSSLPKGSRAPWVHSDPRQHRFPMSVSALRPGGSRRDARESPAMQFDLKSHVDASCRRHTCTHRPVLTISLLRPPGSIRGCVSIGSRCQLVHHGLVRVGGMPGNPPRCSLTLSHMWTRADAGIRAPTGPF